MRKWVLYKRVVIPAVYVVVIVLQLILWPACEDGSSSSLLDDLEDSTFEPAPLPVNPLDPPMWGSQLSLTATGHCGTWQKQYTKLHRAMLSGELPPSYLVYTTGQGFPPVIEGVPQAMKGIATVFMIALLTERAFILDWQSPSGFDRVTVPRYINWKPEDLFTSDSASSKHPAHTHDIGSPEWFQNNNGSIDFYTKTNFDEYFASKVEVIQSLSYDFTYAILRNPHYRHKLQNLGLHTAKCRLCCIWHYLFKYASEFQRKMNMFAKTKLGLSTSRDLLFMDISFQHEKLPKRTVMQYASSALKCAERISKSLRSPIWAVASNSYIVLDELPKMYPKIGKNALFFSKERYHINLQRELNSTETHLVTVPRYEHNALMYFFMGWYLQLNSTVLFTSHHSQYSASMAGLRYFYHSSGRYIVNLEEGCQLKRYGA